MTTNSVCDDNRLFTCGLARVCLNLWWGALCLLSFCMDEGVLIVLKVIHVKLTTHYVMGLDKPASSIPHFLMITTVSAHLDLMRQRVLHVLVSTLKTLSIVFHLLLSDTYFKCSSFRTKAEITSVKSSLFCWQIYYIYWTLFAFTLFAEGRKKPWYAMEILSKRWKSKH